jgi:uncharacterized protein YhaN
VAQLRRRLQIDERLDQMQRHQAELDEQKGQARDRQLLPGWVTIAIGVGFVLGGAAFLFGLLWMIAGFFRGASTVSGWPLTLFGLIAAAASIVVKVVLERSSVHKFESSQKQLGMLSLQIQQARDEREVLDRQLPKGGGPIAGRLAAAEQELAGLESLLPLETRRAAAGQEAAAATKRAAQAEQDLRTARHGWHNNLAAAGLPKNFAPRQVRAVMRRCDQVQDLQRRLKQRREEFDQRRRDLDGLMGRVAQLVADCGVEIAAKQPTEQIRQLAEVLSRQQGQLARREAIRRQLRKLRRGRQESEEAMGRLKQRRRALLRQCGVEDEAEFRRRAAEAARAEALRRDRDVVEREINAAIGGHCPQEAIRQQLEGTAALHLEARRDETRARLAAIQGELRGRLEKRGQLAEAMKSLADDRQLANKQLDLAVLERRLDEALRRWQVLAVTCRVLEKIRALYEHERQPETLREASGYLDRFTQGRYRRVWTPLGENVLRVDDAEGRSLGVEMLSQGTREQLFLSLRLALAACFARRGAPLPLVLDDVLVNFDAERAKAAAAVLRDFAAAGHQLLVFTCHEHIEKIFKSLKVAVATLPSNAEAGPEPIVFEEAPPEKPKRTRKSPAAPRKPAKPEPEPEPEPEEEEEEEPVEEEAEEEEVEEEDEELDDEDEETADDERLWEEEDDVDESADDEDLFDEEDDERLWEEEEDEDAEAA